MPRLAARGLELAIDERGLPKICTICRRHSRHSGGIFIWGFLTLIWAISRTVLSPDTAARHQHWLHRNFLDRLSYPEHPEPSKVMQLKPDELIRSVAARTELVQMGWVSQIRTDDLQNSFNFTS